MGRRSFFFAGLLVVASAFTTADVSGNEIWLAGGDSGSVGVFNAADQSLIAEIVVGSSTEDVDFSRDGRTAFITPFFGSAVDLIWVVNADTRQVIGSIDVGPLSDPQIERRPNSSRLYIGDCFRHELVVIDGDTASAIDLDPTTPGVQGIQLPTQPWKMTFSPDGRFAYATTCSGPPGLIKVDLEQNAFVKIIYSSSVVVNSVDISDDGSLAVVGGSNKVGIVDLIAEAESGVYSLPQSADGVALHLARHRAYALAPSTLYELDVTDSTNPVLVSTTNLEDPQRPGSYNGQSVRRVGNLLYVTFFTAAGTNNSEVVVLDISGPPQIIARRTFGSSAFSEVVLRPVPQVGSTPSGTNVQVAVTAGLPNGSTAPVLVSFGTVLSSGQTTVTTSTQGAPPPSGFKLGTPPVYYDVSTTATFSGTATLCFTWTEGQFHNENVIRLWHMESNAWHDVTSSVDKTNNVACGTVTSLSPFILTETAYTFTGFFQPVDNLPTLNSVKAGSAIPVKFGLGGNYGLSIFDAGAPKSQMIACDSSTADAIEETTTAGSSALSYDVTSGRYNYVWKTDKAWAGTCRQLILDYNDGSLQKAAFKFTK